MSETFDRKGNRVNSVKFFVGLTEYGVRSWPQGMEGCRFFRIEYGGFNEECVCEGSIWIPPTIDRDVVEEFLQAMFRDWDEEEYRVANPNSPWLPTPSNRIRTNE